MDKTISSIINESLLDLQYIYNITENLSKIIFTEYNESAGELAKGRAFGSKGEHKAADIIYENMTILGLWTKKEPIKNIKEKPYIACKIDINERGLSIINKTSHTVTPVVDCFISGRSNLTDLYLQLKEFQGQKPVIGWLLLILLTKLIPINGRLDKKYDIYNTKLLTYNFSYKSLEVIKKPYNYSLVSDFIYGIKNDDSFVYIDLDGSFTYWPWSLQETKFKGFFYKNISKIINFFGGDEGYTEKLIWTIFHPNCKAIIKVDSNNDTYNMGHGWAPVPIITVNRTIGLDIYKNPQNYCIDFYINQSWNESVESYNVIGQLNGTDFPNHSIIVCSLYDSWWCQGTGDAAIGMAMVLGIAKYFKDHKIKPKCNIKFIAFGGEEYSFRGAYYHEILHRNELYTPYIIDINQVGFTPIIPENIKLQIWVNNQTLNETIGNFAEEINYTNRTGIGFQTRYIRDGGPSNTRAYAVTNSDKRWLYNTIMVVKTGYEVPGPQWLNHHRDGINHGAGDVIDFFNWNDTSTTGELIWNITNYFTNRTFSISIDN